MAQTREIRQGGPLGVRPKIFTPPDRPQILKILHYESSFARKTRINLGGSATKISFFNRKLGNSPWEFQIWGQNFDRK